MHFQVRTDSHLENTEELAARIQGEVERALGNRFDGRVRRVEVYLRDVNSHKGGIDKRCSIEAQLAGHTPVAVHGQAAGLDEAVRGAADKLVRTLAHTLGRLADRHRRPSTPGEET